MTIKLKNIDNERILISMGKNKLEVNIEEDAIERNPDWNTKKINDFLIDVAASLELEDKLSIEAEGNEENVIFSHIVNLFKVFTEEYNR